MRRFVAIALVALTVAIAVGAVAALASRTQLGRALFRRGSDCPLGETLAICRNTEQQAQLAADIRAKSTLRQSEPGYELWQTPAGDFWIPAAKLGMYYLSHMIAEEQRDIYATSEIRSGETVLDCGACVGTFTRQALLRGAQRVIAVDADPRNGECLRRTFAREVAQGRVIVVAKALWDREGTMNLNITDFSSGGASLVRPFDRTVPVPTTAIDTLIQELGVPVVHHIKMDIEGAEKRALRGAARTIAAHRPRLSIAAEHEADDCVAIPAVIQSIARYDLRYGPCAEFGGRIRREAMYFSRHENR